MKSIYAIALALGAGIGAMTFAGAAQAACEVTGGTATSFNCSDTGVNVRVDSGTDVTLDVTDMTIEGTNDSTGYITYHNNSGVPANLTLNIENTSIDSPAYLGVFAATGDIGPDAAVGDLTLTIDEASSITAWDAGIYARVYDGGDVKVTNYADIFAGTVGETMVFGGVGISAVSDGGSATLNNYGNVTSYTGRGLYADGGYVAGAELVSIYNEGEVNAFGDAVRAIAGGSHGTDATIVNYGNVTGQDRRGIVAWSASGDTTIENHGEVTSNGGQAIYGMADAGKVTITNDSKLRVYDGDPLEADVDDTSFAGIEAEVDGTGDVEVSNLEGGDILTYDHGIYAHTGSGDVTVTNRGLITAGMSGIATESTTGDVSIDNYGTVLADGLDCDSCDDLEFASAIWTGGSNLGEVAINNRAGGVVAANAALSTVPTEAWLDSASLSELIDLATSTSSRFAIVSYAEDAESVTITNDGTVVGNIAIGNDGGAPVDSARIENRGLWVTTGYSGTSDSDGVIANSGRIYSIGSTGLYASVENSGDIVVAFTGVDSLESGYGVGIRGDYDASGDARLVLDWPDENLLQFTPALLIEGDVTGTTEVVIGRGGPFGSFDWNGTPVVPVVYVGGTAEAGSDSFHMDDVSYGMLTFRLAYQDVEGEGEVWYLELDAVNGAEAVAEIPFAARNLFKLATEGVTDRLDQLRNGFAGNRVSGAPMGYAATPDDPVTATLALNQPAQPTTNAWFKTTGRLGQGEGYDTLTGVIEAGIDTLVDTGSGTVAIGAFAGLGSSQVDFELANSQANLTGPLVGAYGNYSSGRAFVGVVGAIQSLDVDLALSGAEANFGGVTYGGRIDAGYRFGDELIVEPAVALAASHTEFDTFEMNAMDVGFVDTDSLATEARVRISRDFVFDGVTLTPFAVATLGHDFLGGDGVDAPSNDVVMGSNGGTYGDLSGGLTITNADGTLSGFARGNLGYNAGEISGGAQLGANVAF